jgi:tetratricopeptide (TPR) repeat protein
MTDAAGASGELKDTPLQEVLAAHASARSSGRLTVTTSAGQGTVSLWDGNVAEATFGPVSGEAAIIRLLTFAEGHFAFEPRPGSIPGVHGGAVQALLDKAAAHQAEVEKYAAHVGSLNDVPILDLKELSRRKADIPDELGPVLRLVDGRRSVRDIMSSGDMEDVTVLRVLKKLRGMSVLLTTQDLQQRQQALRAQEEAAAAPPVVVTQGQPVSSFEDMLLQRMREQAAARDAMLALAIPEFMKTAPPPTSPDVRSARHAVVDRFAASNVPVTPFPTPVPAALAPTRPDWPAVAAPAPHRAPEPVPPSVEAARAFVQDVTPPVPRSAGRRPTPVAVAVAAARDSVRLRKPAAADAIHEPVVVRWTDRPPVPDPMPEVTPAPGMDAPSWPNTSPPIRFEPAPAPPLNPRTGPEPGSAAAQAAAHHAEDDAFFRRGHEREEIEALMEQEASAQRERDNQRFFGRVAAGVCVAVGVLAFFIWQSAQNIPLEPEPEQEAQRPLQAPPIVVLPDHAMQVRSPEEAIREAAQRGPQEDEPAPEPQRSTAELAAELAAPAADASVRADAAPPVPPTAPPVDAKGVAAPTGAQADAVPGPAPAPKPAPAKAEPPKPVVEDNAKLFADRYEKGRKFLDQERYQDAKKAFESALRFEPGSAKTYTQLGRAQYELGNLDEALKLLKKSESLDGRHAYTFLVMGLVLQERGDRAGAVTAYERFLALESTGANAQAVRGFLKALKK